MKETVDAIYENGVLRPLRKLRILDGERIRVTVETAHEQGEKPEKGAENPFTVVRRALSGCSGSLVDDLAADREDRA